VIIEVQSSYANLKGTGIGTKQYLRGTIVQNAQRADNMLLSDDKARILSEPYCWISVEGSAGPLLLF